MARRMQKGVVVAFAVVGVAAMLAGASAWQAGAGAGPGAGSRAGASESAKPHANLSGTELRAPWESSVDSCPYVYNFDQQNYYYSTKTACERAGADWCPAQVGYQCNNTECDNGSSGECPTAVVSVFFECYYVTEYGWRLTCRCFCWVVKK